MIENPRPEEENIIKNVRNLFILKKLRKEIIDNTIKDIRNLFRLEKAKKKKKLNTEYLEISKTFLN